MISSFSRIFGMATPYSYVRGLAKLEPKTGIDLLKANASSTVMAGKIDSNPVQAVISLDSAFGRIQRAVLESWFDARCHGGRPASNLADVSLVGATHR